MTPFPLKPVAALVADWAITNVEALHRPVMLTTSAWMQAGVPATVAFAEKALPGLTHLIFGGDVAQAGANVAASWPQAFDAVWSFGIDAARGAAQRAFGDPPAVS